MNKELPVKVFSQNEQLDILVGQLDNFSVFGAHPIKAYCVEVVDGMPMLCSFRVDVGGYVYCGGVSAVDVTDWGDVSYEIMLEIKFADHAFKTNCYEQLRTIWVDIYPDIFETLDRLDLLPVTPVNLIDYLRKNELSVALEFDPPSTRGDFDGLFSFLIPHQPYGKHAVVREFT